MTRCNIVVNDSTDTLYIYHHCDGYPKGVGQQLIKYLQCNTPLRAQDVLDGLVFMYGEEYEETSSVHGDIEYLYTIDIRNDRISLKCDDVYANKKAFSCDFAKGDVIETALSKKDIERLEVTIELKYDTPKSKVYQNMPVDMNIPQRKFVDMVVDEVTEYLKKKSLPDHITIRTTLTPNDTENKHD